MRELILKFEAEILRLRWLTTLKNLETAVRRRMLDPKYNPEQPRDEIGRWTSDGSSGTDRSQEPRVRLASDTAPQIPEDRPKTPKERLSIAKGLAQRLAALGRAFRRLSVAGWMLEYEPEIRSYLDDPKTLAELLNNAAGPSQRGYEDHHIVEQGSAEDYGFPRDMIDGSDNLVRIPTWKHQQINGWYQTKNDRFGGLSPREYLQDKDWDERVRVGREALIRFKVLKP